MVPFALLKLENKALKTLLCISKQWTILKCHEEATNVDFYQ